MASSSPSLTHQAGLQSRIDDLSRQLDAARAQLAGASAGTWVRCASCNAERRPEELFNDMCRPCRQIRDMTPHMVKLRTVTEMTLLMAGELSEVIGQSRYVILDRCERQAAARIAAADRAVQATRASA